MGQGEPHLRWDVGSEVSSPACDAMRGVRRVGAVFETTRTPESHQWLPARRAQAQSQG